MKNKIAVSACLLGKVCRYDGLDNKNEALLALLNTEEMIPFCPEDDAFGTPRPTMDLIAKEEGIRAISNETGEDLSAPIKAYAKAFFDTHPEITHFIGKDRSPSCGVCSAKVYSQEKVLLRDNETGLMAKEARLRGICSFDAEVFVATEGSQ